jgi:hypothetical protein
MRAVACSNSSTTAIATRLGTGEPGWCSMPRELMHSGCKCSSSWSIEDLAGGRHDAMALAQGPPRAGSICSAQECCDWLILLCALRVAVQGYCSRQLV